MDGTETSSLSVSRDAQKGDETQEMPSTNDKKTEKELSDTQQLLLP